MICFLGAHLKTKAFDQTTASMGKVGAWGMPHATGQLAARDCMPHMPQ